ncbi:hypothetical protein [Methylobacterium sp. J-090]|uniref:hypothetical protein n=1 Tax=Methylobacterium sp. J-090 TaxID=2836666 RepID=UPI001FBAE800|nr:hypothetical protein [Methylobacterium sp. J-090]MCJ2081783.1 hypothetical protein [Methylobacterium sp. J-090]
MQSHLQGGHAPRTPIETTPPPFTAAERAELAETARDGICALADALPGFRASTGRARAAGKAPIAVPEASAHPSRIPGAERSDPKRGRIGKPARRLSEAPIRHPQIRPPEGIDRIWHDGATRARS